MLKEGINRRGQVTIFIIIAIVIVAGVGLYFLFRGSLNSDGIPSNLEPVYAHFQSCLEEYTLVGIDVLESQGGYIYLPDFEPGSSYSPFSSQLNFLGNGIPYWYYVSGNNLEKEQVPTKSEMEEQLGLFVQNKINSCVFDNFYDEGYAVYLDNNSTIDVAILEDKVEVNFNYDFGIEGKNDSVIVSNHIIGVDSQLGNLYDSANEVYDYENENLFLEEYTVDILRLYAPVDGIEMQCSPLTWSAEDVFADLAEAIEANILSLKSVNGDYDLQNKYNKYFVVDLPVEENVRFLTSQDWPYSYEVNPSEDALMISEPIGNQQGLGILGFCYVPYHFVYSVKYPVLIQVESGDEIFQFPMAVIVEGNNPREALDTSAFGLETFEFCEYANTPTEVNVFDNRLYSVEANVSYKCAGTSCNIGVTENGYLESEFPQCANGFVIARAEGYADAVQEYSTTESGSVDIFLNKLYEEEIDLKLNNVDYGGEALITFASDSGSRTILYPETKSVELQDGQYNVTVYIYKNSSLKFSETTIQQCTEVPSSGLGGLVGLTEEQCFDITIPEQIISNVLAGGGTQSYYVTESELMESKVIEINVPSLPIPSSLEELQVNYIAFEDNSLRINFK